MARFDVDVRLRPGHHVRRKVRAKSGHAAYERVAREHVESGGEWSLDLAIVTRRGLRRKSTVLTGPGPDADGGTAGVREPRRPQVRAAQPAGRARARVSREDDLVHLRRCVELAREALEAGDEPFGSLLADGSGEVRFEERNRVKDGDETRHPEFEIARWSASHLTAEERAASTVYTSGEHCAMCSAAHAWMGLGPIVYAGSTAQLVAWRTAWGLAPSPVRPLSVREVAPGIQVRGPFAELEDELRDLHRRQAERRG